MDQQTDKGRFPFHQTFQFEILGNLRDEWNGVFQFSRLICVQVTTSQVSNENTKFKKNDTLCPFNHFLLCLELLDDFEFETDDVLGEDDNITFISVESSYMHRNVQGVLNYIKGTIPLYSPDEFKNHFE